MMEIIVNAFAVFSIFNLAPLINHFYELCENLNYEPSNIIFLLDVLFLIIIS